MLAANSTAVPELVKAVQQRFNQPNLYGEASAEFVQDAVGNPVDDNTAICDCILGTSISGSGHTVGQTTAELIPDDNQGVINTLLFATTYSAPSAHTARCAYIPAARLVSGHANGYGLTTTDSFPARPYPTPSRKPALTIFKPAGKFRKCRLEKSRPTKIHGGMHCIATCRAAGEQACGRPGGGKPGQSPRNFHQKIPQPPVDHKLFPEQLKFSTDQQALRMVSIGNRQSLLAAQTPPPSAITTDMVLRVHESLINNFTLMPWAG